jgi:hypothetical protein
MDAWLGVRRDPRVREYLCGEDVKMKPRDFKKAAPYLGAILLVAIVFYVVRSLL